MQTEAIRSRNCWFLIISKLGDKFELNVGYKAADNTVSLVSAAKRTARYKAPFGPPTSCQFGKLRNNQGQDAEYFTFKNKYGTTLNLKASLMNNLFSAESEFSRKCTSLIVQKKPGVLAAYLTLLSCSKDFSHHRGDLHRQNGIRIDGKGLDEHALLERKGSLGEFMEFKQSAEESAITISGSHIEVITKIVENNSDRGAKKRKQEDDSSKSQDSKVSKTQAKLIAFQKERDDSKGVEQTFINSYVGCAEVPIENIDISPKICPRIIRWKVEGIANSMKTMFDPAKAAITVAPLNPEQCDRNLRNNKYVVISGNHTLSALKTLDERGDLRTLVGMENGDVMCYIVNTQNPSILCYGGLRSKDIGSKFVRKPQVQDLLFVFKVLKGQLSKEKDSIESVIRYAKLLLFSADDITALKKICSWKDEHFSNLLSVIEKYEIFQTIDGQYKGNQELLKRGMVMSLPKVLFSKLSKLNSEYFVKNVNRVLDKEISLKTLIEGFNDCLKVEKVKKLVCQLSNISDIKSLKEKFPGKFKDLVLVRFAGADIEGDVMNEPGRWLTKYVNSVISGSDETADPEVVKFRVLPSLDWFLEEKFNEVDVIVFNLNSDSQNVAMSIFERMSNCDKLQFVLILFDSERCQSSTLSLMRGLKVSSELRIEQIIFNRDKSALSGSGKEISENLYFGILLGTTKVFAPPLDTYNGDLANLQIVIAKLCPTTSSVASVSQGNLPLLRVHRSEISAGSVWYLGGEKSINDLRTKLTKVKTTVTVDANERSNADRNDITEVTINREQRDDVFNEDKNRDDSIETPIVNKDIFKGKNAFFDKLSITSRKSINDFEIKLAEVKRNILPENSSERSNVMVVNTVEESPASNKKQSDDLFTEDKYSIDLEEKLSDNESTDYQEGSRSGLETLGKTNCKVFNFEEEMAEIEKDIENDDDEDSPLSSVSLLSAS